MNRTVLRALRGFLAVGLAGAALTLPTGAAASETQGLSLAGKWHPFPGSVALANTVLALDAPTRALYTVYQDGNGTGPIKAQLWNVDTLRARSAATVISTRGTLSAASPTAVDERRHALVLAEPPATGMAPTLAVVRSSQTSLSLAGDLATRFPASYSVVGMAVDPGQSYLYVLAEPAGCVQTSCVVQTAGTGVGGVEIDALSLSNLSAGKLTSPWTAPVQVPQLCGQVITTNFPAGLVISPDDHRVFFGCASNRGLSTTLGTYPGDVDGVAELTISTGSTATGTLEMHTVPGIYSRGDSIAVPGPARLMLTSPNGNQTSVKIFDTRHGYYVGLVGVDDIRLDSIGVNEVTGQSYYVFAGGLTSVDMGALPVPQGQIYPEYATLLGSLLRRMVVDPKTHRVFVPTAEDLIGGTVPYVAVLRDTQPRDGSNSFAPSLRGVDAPEVTGITDSARVAVAGAVGAESRLVGGTGDVLVNVTHTDTRGIVTRPGTRDLQMGVISGVQLANNQASATAVTEAQDNATTSDSNVSAPAVPVQCLDFGGSVSKGSADSESTTCDLDGQNVTAKATSQGGRILLNSPDVSSTCAKTTDPQKVCETSVPDAVQIKSASVSVTSQRHGLGSLDNIVTAEADGISILGVVTIGRVVTEATTTAHGRSGSAKTTYTRTVSGLEVGGKVICDSTCPLATVAGAIHTAFSGRVHVEFPAPYQQATKDGRVAMVADNPYHHVEQVLFDDVSDDNVNATGMSISVLNDGDTKSREIVTLAAISAQSNYQIFPVGSGPFPSFGGHPSGVTSSTTTPNATTTVPSGGSLVAPAELPRAPEVSNTPNSVGGFLSNAIHLAFRSPGTILGVAVMWMLLAVPAYLAARRRLLNDLPLLTAEETS